MHYPRSTSTPRGYDPKSKMCYFKHSNSKATKKAPSTWREGEKTRGMKSPAGII